MFACFMDASKAFNRINHDMLFDILECRGLNPIILRLLEYLKGKLDGVTSSMTGLQ